MGYFDRFSVNVKAALVTVAVTVALAVIASAYSIGYGIGAKDLAAVEDFKKTLPGMMADLGKLAKTLNDNAQIVEDNRRLAKEASDVANENKQLKLSAKQRDDELTGLKKERTACGSSWIK